MRLTGNISRGKKLFMTARTGLLSSRLRFSVLTRVMRIFPPSFLLNVQLYTREKRLSRTVFFPPPPPTTSEEGLVAFQLRARSNVVILIILVKKKKMENLENLYNRSFPHNNFFTIF